MLTWDIQSYREAVSKSAKCVAPQVVFFDRGIPDVVGYLRLMSLPVPSHVSEAARQFRYDRRVFIAPPWEDIFGQDAERRQTFAEAVATYEAMVQVYTEIGYALPPLPRSSVHDRVEYVLNSLKLADSDAMPEETRR